MTATYTHVRHTQYFSKLAFTMVDFLDQAAIRRRVKQLIAEPDGSGKQVEFAAAVDMQPGMISKLIAGKRDFTLPQLVKIEQGTGARLAWLILGVEPIYYPNGQAPDRAEADHYEGTMLRRYLSERDFDHAELARRIGRSANTVQGYLTTEVLASESKKRILDALDAPIDEVFNVKPLLGLSQSFELPKREEKRPAPDRRIPIQLSGAHMASILRIPIRARASFGFDAFHEDAPKEREYIPVSEDRLYPGIPADRHFVIEVNGDSMEPVLEHGYEVLAYRMLEGQLPVVDKIVVVDFREELTIKRLTAIDYVAQTITLRSDNGGSEIRLPMGEVRAIAHVYDYYKARL